MSRDRTVGDTFYIAFTTKRYDTGAPTVLAGTPVVSAYEDGSITQITAGVTLGVDHDSVVGLNLLTLVATGGNGFESGKDYNLVITTGTVNSVSVVGEVVGQFSLGLSAAAVDLANGTDGLGALNTAIIDVPNTVWDEDIVAAHNTLDTAGLILSNVSNLSVGAGGIATTAISATVTTGTETLTYTATQELEGTTHDIAPSGGNTEFYYEFTVGITGVATTILWDGHAESNNDSYTVSAYDWVTAGFRVIGTISGTNTTNIIEQQFTLTAAMTGTAANAGVVRWRITSADGTNFSTDRVLVEYTSLPDIGLLLHAGVAQGAAANTITLDSGANSTDNFYNHARVVISSGTGSEQERIIVDYVGSTRIAKIAPPWITTPDSTSAFEVVPALAHAETGWNTVKVGLVVAATSTSITLDATASSLDDFYVKDLVHIDSGTGEGETRVITAYNGTTKVATVDPAWAVTPDTTSEYVIQEGHPYLTSDLAELKAETALILTDTAEIGAAGAGLTAIADIVWDEVLTGGTHNVNNSAGKRLRATSGTILTDGTAQAGGTNSLQLASGDISIDNQYARAKVIIVGGTGTGQEAIITDSTASTDTIATTPDWLVQPDNTSDYQILPAQVHATVRNGGYDLGYVYLDATNGTAGIVKGVNGTTTLPSLNIAEARTIANNENITKFSITGGGLVTLDQTYVHWIFEVVNAVLLNLGSQDIGGSVFMRTGITGTGTGTDRVVFELCGLDTATVNTCNFLQCGFTNTTTLSSETSYLAWNCFCNDSGIPIINMAGDGITATTLELIGYNGRIEIQNMTSTDLLIVTGNAHLTLNANCSGGVVTLAGDINVTDNSGNLTITTANIADIIVDTAEIGTAGAGLTDITVSAASVSLIQAGLSTFDATSDTVSADVTAISGDSTAADNLEASLETLLLGTATGSLTTTTMADSALTETTNSHYNGRVIIWRTGVLAKQATDITAYNGTTKTLTFTATTEAPGAGDAYVIV